MEKVHPFEPVYDKNSKILILGTLPSIESVKQGFYYMHPQNRFWKVLSSIYQVDVYHAGVEEKKAFILGHHLALYDVISMCSIEMSSDASIRNVKFTNIKAILEKSEIDWILLNGKKAYHLFIQEYPEYKDISMCLPSTSAANARLSLVELTESWKRALLKL